MNIPADKLAHLKAGGMAAVVGAAVGGITAAIAGHYLAITNGSLAVLVLLCIGVGAACSSLSAGITKELADHADNEVNPGMHGVEPDDAIATALPGVVTLAACIGIAALVA